MVGGVAPGAPLDRAAPLPHFRLGDRLIDTRVLTANFWPHTRATCFYTFHAPWRGLRQAGVTEPLLRSCGLEPPCHTRRRHDIVTAYLPTTTSSSLLVDRLSTSLVLVVTLVGSY